MLTKFLSVRFTRVESGRTTRKSSTCRFLHWCAEAVRLFINNALKQVGFKLGLARPACGRQVEHFLGWHFAQVLAQPVEQWRLRGVHPESQVLFLEPLSAHFDAGRDGNGRDRHSVWEHEICSAVVELLGAMRRQTLRQ